MSNLNVNNLSIAGNLTLANNLISSSNIQTTGTIICADLQVNANANLSMNNLNFTGLLNNKVSPSNLLSLDTTTSINTTLTNLILQQQIDMYNINILNSHYQVESGASGSNYIYMDTSGNITINATATNSAISMINSIGTEMSIKNGVVSLTNSDTSAQVQFQIIDTLSGNNIFFSPKNTGTSDYNPITSANSSIIASTNSDLCLTNYITTSSLYSSGIVISEEHLLIGSGLSVYNLPSSYLYFDTSGIGLNKQTPSYQLDVNGTINATTILINGTYNIETEINNNTTYVSSIQNNLINTGGNIVLQGTATSNTIQIGNNNYFYINSSGIGLNQNNPSHTLDIFGDLNCDGVSTTALNSNSITLNNGSIGDVTTYLQNTSNEITGIQNLAIKVYGYWSSSTNTFTIGANFFLTPTYNVLAPNGTSPSLKIPIKTVPSNIIGIVIAMCSNGVNSNGGYTLQGYYDAGIATIYISTMNGGSSPGYINSDFYFILF